MRKLQTLGPETRAAKKLGTDVEKNYSSNSFLTN